MDHPPDHDMGGDMGDMGHEGMMMYFHAGTNATILFKFWKTDEIGGFLGSLVLIFFLGVAYEALKFFRDYLQMGQKQKMSKYQCCVTPAEDGSRPCHSRTPPPPKLKMLTGNNGIQTGLHFVQFVLSYSLMLVFMTYNIWICLSVSLGVTVGYFIFGWQRESAHDSNECCH